MLARLQAELVNLQLWVRTKGSRVIIVFEGRDAAGKGGVIKRITERVSPRVFRVVALPAPSEREKSQLYMQWYVSHFPAAGEIVLFDRSWLIAPGRSELWAIALMRSMSAFFRVPHFLSNLLHSLPAIAGL